MGICCFSFGITFRTFLTLERSASLVVNGKGTRLFLNAFSAKLTKKSASTTGMV